MVTGYTKQGADDEFVDEDELAAGLGGKANTNHTHTVTNVTGLQAALDAKVDDTALTTALPTTVGATGQVLKSDGTAVTWQADANTTYTAATQAEIENPASTTARLVTGQRLAQGVAAYLAANGYLAVPVPPATGTVHLVATDGVLSWEAVV